MCCTLMVVPIHHVRTHRVTRVKIANIERIILSHLASELLPDPVSYRRLALLVKPPEPLHLPYNPFLLALLGEDPAESHVVCSTPESEIQEKENPRGLPGEEEVQDDLKAQETEIEEIDVRFRISRVEQG